MKKLLYVAPHLSTGGLPQYLVKKVELLKDEFEIFVVEYSNHSGGVLVVQRDRILNLVDENHFFELKEDKMELYDIIQKVQPDIVHLEEIPEYFMDFALAEKIYSTDRTYAIVETSHDSSYNTSQKSFFPDKFMFVSNWQIQQYQDIDIPKTLVEYPIEYKDRPDRDEALKALGLDPKKKHVLHIGLFTPRKNQAEFFEYARALEEYDIEFHCVGNQASNFQYYWEPLMAEKPANVTWWNERKDVDNFYKSMDLFLFTSRGSNTDKETMPLVIREALSWNMNLLIYNLYVYLNYFDKFENVDYLDFNDFDKNCNQILNQLGINNKKVNPEQEAVVISTYPITDSITNVTRECIIKVQSTGRKVILTSHCPIPEDLQNLADYCVVDKNNILTSHTFYSSAWWSNEDYKSYVQLKGNGNDVYHGPTVYTNYYNGASLAKNLGIEKLHFLNYDIIIKDKSFLDNISKILNEKQAYFIDQPNEPEGPRILTWYMACSPEFFLNYIPKVNNAKEYDELQFRYGTDSNGLENLFRFAFKPGDQDIYFETQSEFDKLAEAFIEQKNFSRVEYITALPIEGIDTHFATYIQSTNSTDSRTIDYKVHKNNELIYEETLEVKGNLRYHHFIEYDLDGSVYKLSFDSYDINTGKHLDYKEITINDDYIKNSLKHNGLFTIYNEDLFPQKTVKKSKIKLMHLVTEPDTNEKEKRSVENIKEFCQLTGIKYEQRINKIWKETPPKDTCNRPDDVQDVPGYYKLAPGHYGCFVAHTDAILAEDNKDYDYVLIFEGDVIVDSPFSDLRQSLDRFSRLAKENDQDIIGFGNPWKNRNLNGPKVEDIYTDVTPFIPAQSYLINNDKLSYIQDKINTTPWDAFDMWVCNVARLRVGTAEKIYTKHLPGFSIIEQEFKGMDENSPEIYAAE